MEALYQINILIYYHFPVNIKDIPHEIAATINAHMYEIHFRHWDCNKKKMFQMFAFENHRNRPINAQYLAGRNIKQYALSVAMDPIYPWGNQ